MKKKEMKTHLQGTDYWRWRSSISEMQKKELALKNSELEHKLLLKDAEMLGVRSQLFLKTRVQLTKDELAQSKTEYNSIKEELEKYLGYSLNGKVIDDFTFEVRDLPEQQTSKEK
jgi:hypothetical protein